MTSRVPDPPTRQTVSIRSLIFALVTTVILTSVFWNSFCLWRKTPNATPGPSLGMRVECPEKVKLGDLFDVKIIIRNAGKTNLEIGTLDVDDSFTRGLEITSVDPNPYDRVPGSWYVMYKFWQNIAAGQTDQYIFHVRAKNRGIFKGEVDVYNRKGRITSVVAQITIE